MWESFTGTRSPLYIYYFFCCCCQDNLILRKGPLEECSCRRNRKNGSRFCGGVNDVINVGMSGCRAVVPFRFINLGGLLSLMDGSPLGPRSEWIILHTMDSDPGIVAGRPSRSTARLMDCRARPLNIQRYRPAR